VTATFCSARFEIKSIRYGCALRERGSAEQCKIGPALRSAAFGEVALKEEKKLEGFGNHRRHLGCEGRMRSTLGKGRSRKGASIKKTKGGLKKLKLG